MNSRFFFLFLTCCKLMKRTRGQSPELTSLRKNDPFLGSSTLAITLEDLSCGTPGDCEGPELTDLLSGALNAAFRDVFEDGHDPESIIHRVFDLHSLVVFRRAQMKAPFSSEPDAADKPAHLRGSNNQDDSEALQSARPKILPCGPQEITSGFWMGNMFVECSHCNHAPTLSLDDDNMAMKIAALEEAFCEEVEVLAPQYVALERFHVGGCSLAVIDDIVRFGNEGYASS